MVSRRIFLVIPDAGTVASSVKSFIWKNNLYSPLREMGNEVVLLDFPYDEFFLHAESDRWLKKHRTAFTEKLWELFDTHDRRAPFDFCFFYLCDGFVDIAVLRAIRARGVPILNYSCNNIHQFHLVRNLTQQVDCSVYAELHAGKKFVALGVPAVHMQMAANPEFYKPAEAPYQFDTSFVGQRYADRGRIVASLVRANINVQAFGPRWSNDGEMVGNVSFSDRMDKLLTLLRKNGGSYVIKLIAQKLKKQESDREEDAILDGHVNGIVDDAKMIEIFGHSRVNLGFATVYAGGHEGGEELYHLRLRDFEIPMSGGFYLTRYTHELETYFKIGEEIECYKTTDELIDKCRFYLKNEGKRDSIRRAGLLRSRTCHTWKNRFNQLFADPLVAGLINARRRG